MVEYVNVKEGYRLQRPAAWEQTSKAGAQLGTATRRRRVRALHAQRAPPAGADVLFVGGGTEVGITVSPIRIRSLEQFGTPQFVGDKLIGAERAKVRRARASCLTRAA